MSIATRVRSSHHTRVIDGAGQRTLADLRPGQTGVIAGWSALLEPAAVRRFEDLGFVDGAEVAVLRRAPLGDPFVYRVAGYEIAVRREHTRHLLVQPR